MLLHSADLEFEFLCDDKLLPNNSIIIRKSQILLEQTSSHCLVSLRSYFTNVAPRNGAKVRDATIISFYVVIISARFKDRLRVT